jgi:hypothetical protein
MLGLARWGLLAICLVNLLPLFTARGGLGEYARGGSLTVAHLGTCFDDVDQVERAHISCSAHWSAGGREVDGTVTELDPAGSRAVVQGASGTHLEVVLPATDVRVFADGATARQADTRSMALGGGVLAVTVALLAWEMVLLARRATARRATTRLGRREPAAT